MVQQPKQKPFMLRCSRCGVATCDCGAEYVPLRQVLLAEIAKTPGDANTVIGRRMGVSENAVRYARAEMQPRLSGDVATRTGVDGIARTVPVRPLKPPTDEIPTEEEEDEEEQQTFYERSCMLMDRMTEATRRRFFAHIKRKYRDGY